MVITTEKEVVRVEKIHTRCCDVCKKPIDSSNWENENKFVLAINMSSNNPLYAYDNTNYQDCRVESSDLCYTCIREVANMIVSGLKELKFREVDPMNDIKPLSDSNPNTVTVTKIDSETIYFSDGKYLTSNHEQDCCEHHYLSMNDLTMDDFKGLEFDLSNYNFFERVVGYGIALKPVNGLPVRIPGYGSNNGYYSDQLDLILSDGKGFSKEYDITDCQVIN